MTKSKTKCFCITKRLCGDLRNRMDQHLQSVKSIDFSEEEKFICQYNKIYGGKNDLQNEIKHLKCNISKFCEDTTNNYKDNIPDKLNKMLPQVKLQADEFNKRYMELKKHIRQLKTETDNALNAEIMANKIDYSNVSSSYDRELDEQKAVVIEELNRTAALPYLTEELLNRIKLCISEIEKISSKSYLNSFISLRANPLKKECNKYSNEYENVKVRFFQLAEVYKSYCEMLEMSCVIPECNAIGIEQLQKKIIDAEEKLNAVDEQEYISSSIDEIMIKLGYELIGHRSVTKKSGCKFRNELYSLGNGTAVNVTFSSDGKVAMELGGLDECDRIPNEDEARKLCDDMQSFCEDYAEISGYLSSKGIIADNISHIPPSEEYAQIINISDYELTDTDINMFTAKSAKTEMGKVSYRSE